ncbi:MAG: hypothetical protein QXT14_03080 [Candidatus Bathyarchaeia archaeon]
MKCWIFPDWECGVEADEIPLEVCRLCVKARLERCRGRVHRPRERPTEHPS